MKKIILSAFLVLITSFSVTFSQSGEMNYQLKNEIKWFADARFGMFIHWTPLGAIDQEIGWTWGGAEYSLWPGYL
jgi:alpha-L-fucosidase